MEKENDCPLCKVSEDTIENLKKQKRNKEKKPIKKSAKIFKIIFIGIIIILGAFIFYRIFSQFFSETKINKNTENFIKTSKVLEIGDMAYDFSAEDSFGNKTTLSEFKNNKSVLLIFWATWCGYCAKELPDLKEFIQEYQDKIQVIVIASGEEEEVVKKYIQEKDIKFPIFLDKDRVIWNQYSIRGTPSHFLINIEGKINYLRPGLALRDDLEIMMTMLPEFW